MDVGGSTLFVGVSFSPDGAKVATASGDLGVQVWGVASGAFRGRIGSSMDAHDLAFSGDGSTVASASPGRGGAEVWDVATGASKPGV